MHDLARRVSGIDRASVYRAVSLFEELGVVQRLNTGWKYKIELTDIFTGHHHHLSCTRCGKTIALHELGLEQNIAALAGEHNFKVTSHQIEIQGLCPECQVLEAPN